VQLATIQGLARYWGTEYAWRKAETKLNAQPQFITEVEGLDLDFIYVRSNHENALPLIVTHGWLDYRADEDHRSAGTILISRRHSGLSILDFSFGIRCTEV
jgi:hypothetical protein